MEKEISLDYKLVDVIATGYYTKGEEQENDYIGSPSIFELEKITVKDSNINIYELLRYDDIKDIERLCIKIIEE